MKIYFSADCHFQHGNIIKYTGRPFKNVENMNSTLIKNFNQKLKKGAGEDKIYHIGDFCFRGGKEASGKAKAQIYEDQINAQITHVMGNHDKNNGVKGGLENATIKFANKLFYLVHRPPIKRSDVPKNIDAVLCGHVHDNWKYKFIGKLPVINVGVDVWNFNLVSTQQVAVFYDKIMRAKKAGE